MELGAAESWRAQPARSGDQQVEQRKGPLVRAAAARAGRRGAVRAHGGHAVPAHRPVRPLAARPRAAILPVRPARGGRELRPGRDPVRGAPAQLTWGPLVRTDENPTVAPI